MLTLNPQTLFRRIFPTARRLLVELDIKRWPVKDYHNVLAIGAGHDPYKKRFKTAKLYFEDALEVYRKHYEQNDKNLIKLIFYLGRVNYELSKKYIKLKI